MVLTVIRPILHVGDNLVEARPEIESWEKITLRRVFQICNGSLKFK